MRPLWKKASSVLKVIAVVVAFGAAVCLIPDVAPSDWARWAAFATAVAVGLQAVATIIDSFVAPSGTYG